MEPSLVLQILFHLWTIHFNTFEECIITIQCSRERLLSFMIQLVWHVEILFYYIDTDTFYNVDTDLMQQISGVRQVHLVTILNRL